MARRAKAGLAAALLLGGLGLALPAQDVTDNGGAGLVSIAQAKTSGSSVLSSSTIKNGMFTISASEYADRVNAAFKDIDQPDYTVSLTKSVDGTTLDMDIRYKSKLVGFAEFCLSDVKGSWIGYSERYSSKTFNRITTRWFLDDDSPEYAAYSILALTLAADSSLSKNDASTILNYLVDNTENRGDYAGSSGHQNGVQYTFLINSSGFAFDIDCS